MALRLMLGAGLGGERQNDLALALGEYARTRLLHIRLYQLASWAFTPPTNRTRRCLGARYDRIAASRLGPCLLAVLAGQIAA